MQSMGYLLASLALVVMVVLLLVAFLRAGGKRDANRNQRPLPRAEKEQMDKPQPEFLDDSASRR